jgi:hypothetical protein
MAKAKASQTGSTIAVNIPIPAELHRRLKIKAITEDLSMREAITAAIEAWVTP